MTVAIRGELIRTENGAKRANAPGITRRHPRRRRRAGCVVGEVIR